MLATHMDEIGLMVAGVKHGFVHIVKVGGVDARIYPGRRVIVHGRRECRGWSQYAASSAERGRAIRYALDHLWIDVGLPARQVDNGCASATWFHCAVRDRIEKWPAGRKALIIARRWLQWRSAWSIWSRSASVGRAGRATVQESGLVGPRPVRCSAARWAIAIDVTFATQHNANDVETFALDKGPTIDVGPNMHPRLVQGLRDAANAWK
jgi:endoglucanase